MFEDSRAKESETGGSPDTFRVRQVTSQSEVALMLEWVAAEGWRPGVYDAESYYRQDPTGFYLAEVDGVPVGGVVLVKYGENFAFGGNLIMKPAFRGKGYARRMARVVMEASGMSDRNVGLESMVDLQDAYSRILGVQFAWKNTRFRGVGSNTFTGVKQDDNPAALVPVKEVDFEHLCVFDASVFGTPRPTFLKTWISQPGMVALAAVTTAPAGEDDEHSQETRIAGYGCIRLSVESYKDVNFSRKIGPIFAESAAVGSQLFAALVATVPPGVPYYIDVPETNESAMKLARESGLESVSQTARMFTKGDGGVKCSMVYGITTLELG
ncbi:holothin acyltransferase-like [Branchiostoma floridae x Branchiostoma belcheri]